MEPTIHGAEVGGDRILVDRISNLVRDPRRHEVWVFQYPNDRRINFVKRVAGVGPESLFVLDGDLYTAPLGSEPRSTDQLHAEGRLEIARKSDAVQEAMFDRYPQIAAADLSHPSSERFQRYWRLPAPSLPGREEWSFTPEGVRADSPTRSLLTFRDAIKDTCDKFADVSSTNHPGKYVVGDVKVAFRVRPESEKGRVEIEIHDPQIDDVIAAHLPIGGEAKDGALTLKGVPQVDLGGFRLEPHRISAVSFSSADDFVTLKVDGRCVASFAFRHPPAPTLLVDDRRQRVAFGVDGASAVFDECGVWRDIYYRPGQLSRFDIPAGQFVLLGDNSASSKDSREWVRMTFEFPDGTRIQGDSEAVIDPENLDERSDNPWKAVGDGTEGSSSPTWHFLDRFGNVHDLGADCWSRLSSRKESWPLVPRDHFLGRAVAIFLPLGRMSLVR